MNLYEHMRVDPRTQSAPCGTAITITSGEPPTDEDGHAIAIVHSQWADRVLKSRAAVLQLHGLDLASVDLVPLCRECRKVYPCPTSLAAL